MLIFGRKMRKFDWKYGIYGCIVGLMLRKIWNRAHERSMLNLRPAVHPGVSGWLDTGNMLNTPEDIRKESQYAERRVRGWVNVPSGN